MSDELGFATPKALVRDLVRLSAGGAVVGTVISALVGPPTSLFLIVSVLLLVTATLGVISAIALKRKIVFLSSDGIRGLDSSGGKTAIRWSDPVKIERGPYLYGPGLRMVRADGSHIVLPLSMISLPAFREAVETFAPRDHTLREALKIGRPE